VPGRPYTIIRLQQFDNDMVSASQSERALVRAALSLLRVDPDYALGVFPVSLGFSGCRALLR